MWADTDKISKILNNLLSNAFKYTPQGGKVVLRSELVPASVAVREFGGVPVPSEKFLKVSVDDTGRGVPREKLGELFVRYHHIATSGGESGPDYGSNGIGLHYTKSLVEKHKGRITAALKEEGGMVFSFILPADDIYADSEKAAAGDDMSLQPWDAAGGPSSSACAAGGEEATVLIV